MRSEKEAELLVTAVGKIVVAVVLVGAVAFSMMKGVPISDEVLSWTFLIVAGCVGASARMSGSEWLSARRARRGG